MFLRLLLRFLLRRLLFLYFLSLFSLRLLFLLLFLRFLLIFLLFLHFFLLLLHRLFLLLLLARSPQRSRFLIKLVKHIIDDILRIEPIKATDPFAFLIDKEHTRVSPDLEMLPAEARPIFTTVEVVEFQARAHLVRTLVVIHVVFHVPAVPTPRGEEFQDFYCAGVLYCREDGSCVQEVRIAHLVPLFAVG